VAAFLIAITVASEDAVMRMLEKEFKGTVQTPAIRALRAWPASICR
jgi:hypothetical protein